MDRKEAETRIKGAEDLARLMLNMMETMNIMNGKQMLESDKNNLKEMLLSMRNLLDEKYKKMVSFSDSIK